MLGRRFYNSKIDFRQISIQQIILLSALFFFFTLTIYGLIIVIRDGFRILYSEFGYLPDIDSEKNRDFFKLISAFFSVLSSHSLVIALLIKKPQQIISYRNPKRKRILNNQTFLHFNFVYWVTKIYLAVAIFGLSGFDFMSSEYIWVLSILILVVLYFESCKTLITFFRKKLRFYIVHLLLLSIVSFGISKIEVYNYKDVDKKLLRYKPILELPESNFTNVDHYTYLDVYYNPSYPNKLAFNNHEVIIDSSYLDLEAYKVREYRPYTYEQSIRLSANKETPMHIIKTIENQVRKAEVRNVIYATQNNDIYGRRFSRTGAKIKAVNRNLHSAIPLAFDTDLTNPDITKVEVIIGVTYIVDGIGVQKKHLAEAIKPFINSHTCLVYKYSHQLSYQKYITFLSAHLSVVDELRNENQKIYLQTEDFRYLNRQEFLQDQRRLKTAFPFRFLEHMIKPINY